MKCVQRCITNLVLGLVFCSGVYSQIENVHISNQVYEFLDRMAIKGIIPLYSNTMIPISRREVADLLRNIEARRQELSGAEIQYLDKFNQEFAHEINPS